MRKRDDVNDTGSWPLAEELLERGDPLFVREVRCLADADRLGDLAPRWYGDRRPQVRQFLFDYLDLPLNAFRHEAFVKRLFKLAEQAEDDEVMARFLVLLDRSVRRMLRAEGFDQKQLFSGPTRQYLRRRAWRYFRTLGKRHPERYVPAVAVALKLYRDDDLPDGLSLLDNWGLIHILFHHSPVLHASARHWGLTPERSLCELELAPLHAELWRQAPAVIRELIREARCRAVRQWAIFLLRRDHEETLQSLPLEELAGWLEHEDPAVVKLAAQLLRQRPDLAAVGVDRLLGLVERSGAETIDVLCSLLAERLRPEAVSWEQAVRLAVSRPLPAARLGLGWLQSRSPTSAAECQQLLALVDAEAEAVRREAVSWLPGVLAAAADFQPEWVLDFLDSKHAEVRAIGWQWLEEDGRIAGAVAVWRKLLESPYDDIRLRLVAKLEKKVAGSGGLDAESGRLDAELLRVLWANVLLNVQRGSKSKPLVLRQLVRRLGRWPEEAAVLLPLLDVALRSLRGPEWRAGLAGVVQAVERNPKLRPLVAQLFPELRMEV